MAQAARRRRRSAGAAGRRLDPGGQPAVLALPRSRPAAGAAHRRRRMPRAATRRSAATPRSRWSTRPAWTSSTVAPTPCCSPAARPGARERGCAGQGARPDWTRQDERSAVPAGRRGRVRCRARREDASACDRPSYVYPLFEQALRIGRPARRAEEHQQRIGELWARFARWPRGIRTPGSVRRRRPRRSAQPGPDNRMISWPYTKLMNSNNMVDQGAALLLCSWRRRRSLRVPADRWVFPYAGTDAHDTYFDRRARRTAPVAGDPDRRAQGARVGRRGSRRCRPTSTSTRASRRRCRSPRPSSACPSTTRSDR